MYLIEKKENWTIIRNDKTKAEIELNNISELKTILDDLTQKHENNVLIDFGNVFYIDSSGLGVLMEAMKELKKFDKTLGILSISKDLLEVFTATKIAQYFKFYKSI